MTGYTQRCDIQMATPLWKQAILLEHKLPCREWEVRNAHMLQRLTPYPGTAGVTLIPRRFSKGGVPPEAVLETYLKRSNPRSFFSSHLGQYAMNEKVSTKKCTARAAVAAGCLQPLGFACISFAMSSSMVGQGLGDTNRGLGTSYNPSTTLSLRSTQS